MTSTEQAQRQRRAAGHYLTLAGETRLKKTLMLAAAALDFPVAQINILDDTTQYTIGQFPPPGERVHLPRTETMCNFTVSGESVLAVEDLRSDPRFARLPGVAAGQAASYLGVPLVGREANAVGTLCVFDSSPRRISGEQQQQIIEYAHIVEDQLEVLRRAAEQSQEMDASAFEVATALRDGQILPWYQPIYDLENEVVTGFEALARWQLPSGQMRDPGRFIRTAEDSDLIVDLDREVIGRAAADLARWRRTRPDLRLNVNVSTRHLELTEGVSTLAGLIAAADVPAAAVSIELTETRALNDEARARTAVADLRQRGFGVLLDDFGTGWSSLDWVLRLNVTGLKVDSSVTESLGTPHGDAVTRAVIAMTADLGLDVVIEGLETRRHTDLARELGYRRAQGYFLAPPLPAAEVDAMVDAMPRGQV